ncbi:hypothetical protein AMTRI_Chr13g125020 [Amborella trichopoda]
MTEKKGIHLVKWNTICLPQAEGGLRIRDIVHFNITGMMKLAWRILADPSSLMTQFFKHRYFKNSSIWETKYKRYSSYAWKGIRLGLSQLKDNVRWVIGDSQLVDFWVDPWLSEESIWDSYGTIVHQDLRLLYQRSLIILEVFLNLWFYRYLRQPHRDFLVWINSASSLFSTKEAWEFIRNKGTS